MQCFKNAALSRTTAKMNTNMNAESSRLHAIFMLHIKQQRVVLDGMLDDGKERDTTEMFTDFETLTAKFHFIDLACHHPLISVNCGLVS
ncbi:Kinesin-like protein KIF21A [Lamellibrachia satsuma]|nr:Kinesin-like protein KIF21A [Lamellibrachia satsuma]